MVREILFGNSWCTHVRARAEKRSAKSGAMVVGYSSVAISLCVFAELCVSALQAETAKAVDKKMSLNIFML